MFSINCKNINFPIFSESEKFQQLQSLAKKQTMDLYDFDSSDERDEQIDNHSSSGGCKTVASTLSTDNDRPNNKKSKIIKKNYEPIKDGNVVVRYEEDPVQYKRLRKKIQNRESAARVRGRKKGTMESLEVQVQQLKKVNSELMLKNASLQTQNRSLKNEIQFLRGVIRPNKLNNTQNQSIDKYLNLSSSNSQKSEMKPEEHFESPFEQEDSSMSWVRSSYSAGAKSNWSTLFVLTIMVCIFVLPQNGSVDTTIIAKQTQTSTISPTNFNFDLIFSYSKVVIKYLVILGYMLFAGSFAYSKYWKRKLKKI